MFQYKKFSCNILFLLPSQICRLEDSILGAFVLALKKVNCILNKFRYLKKKYLKLFVFVNYSKKVIFN